MHDTTLDLDRTYRHQLRVQRRTCHDRDAHILILTRYSWLGSGHDQHDDRSEVLTDHGWQEFEGFALLDDYDLPMIPGIDQGQTDAVDKKLANWEERIKTIFDAELGDVQVDTRALGERPGW